MKRVFSRTRCEYFPVHSTAASLRQTVLENTPASCFLSICENATGLEAEPCRLVWYLQSGNFIAFRIRGRKAVACWFFLFASSIKE